MDPRTRRTVDALLRAAQELFAERSVDEVGVEQIAGRAGVAVGSIYNHFGSKAGLYAAAVREAVEHDRAHMDRAHTAQDRDPVGQLYSAAHEYLEFYLRSPEYFRMLAFPHPPGRYPAGGEVADQLADSVRRQNDRLVEALDRGVADGVVREIDTARLATALWAAWNGIISLAWRPDSLAVDEAELRALLRTATDALAGGLLADAGQRPRA